MTFTVLSVFFLLCSVLAGVLCAVQEDEVFSLPGWTGSLPTKQYSGYLSTLNSTTKKFHYWFVESARDPLTDPVVLWLNGGPGCSSLDGYFNELGPLHFNKTSDTPQNLVENPYNWNQIANIIFLESPTGVGFSYSTKPETDYVTDDYQTAFDNYGVLTNFFKVFPEYRKNDFFVTGESYAGIYIPTLVDTITKMNKKADHMINLKGFMVGNGCIGSEVGSCGDNTRLKIHMDFYYQHGLISNILYNKLDLECGNFDNLSIPCSQLVNEASKAIGNVNIYDIYEPCFNNLLPGQTLSRTRYNSMFSAENSRSFYGPIECLDDHIAAKYFDSTEVRKAIHVESIAVIGNWRMCSKKLVYNSTVKSLLPIYPELIKKYRTLIYNGDVDGCVPYTGDQMWTSSLGIPVLEEWRAWSVDDQVAGYITEYANDFKFVTVKGSGHMVPQFRPKQSLAMFEHFINKSPF